jgi:hypothetical protein
VRGIQTFDVDAEVKNPCAVEQLGLTQAIVFDKVCNNPMWWWWWGDFATI